MSYPPPYTPLPTYPPPYTPPPLEVGSLAIPAYKCSFRIIYFEYRNIILKITQWITVNSFAKKTYQKYR